MTTKTLTALLIGLAVLFTAGCAALQSAPLVAKIAVQQATLRLIETQPEAQVVQKAHKVAQFAKAAKQWALTPDTVTVPQLAEAARERLQQLDLTPSERLLANDLVALIEQELRQRLGQQGLSEDARVTVNQVLTWVIEAADVYTGGPSQ